MGDWQVVVDLHILLSVPDCLSQFAILSVLFYSLKSARKGWILGDQGHFIAVTIARTNIEPRELGRTIEMFDTHFFS